MPGLLVVLILALTRRFSEHLAFKISAAVMAPGLAGAIGQAGNISGYVMVTLLFAAFARLGYSRNALFSFKSAFFLAALFGLAAFVFAVCMKEPHCGRRHIQRRRFYFAKKFTKRYFLEVFYGARKQIFLTFAPTSCSTARTLPSFPCS
jgi:hypothetical protein